MAGTSAAMTKERWDAMNYWLVKSEPAAWSWDQQVAKGAKGEAWTGVRNFTARQNLVKMKKGDRAFFYHSNEGKEIVGVAEIIKEAYPDPTDKTGKFVCVDIKADKPLKTPVTMAAITQAAPRIMQTSEAADRPIVWRMRVKSSQSLNPRDSLPGALRSAPHTWQKRAPTTNSLPHSGHASARDCTTVFTSDPRGGCQ